MLPLLLCMPCTRLPACRTPCAAFLLPSLCVPASLPILCSMPLTSLCHPTDANTPGLAAHSFLFCSLPPSLYTTFSGCSACLYCHEWCREGDASAACLSLLLMHCHVWLYSYVLYSLISLYFLVTPFCICVDVYLLCLITSVFYFLLTASCMHHDVNGTERRRQR